MARIEGVDLPRNKRIEIGLTYLYGVGLPRAQETLTATKVDPNKRVKDLTDAEVGLLRDYIVSHFKVEGDLRREVQLNIKRLIEIGSYRGLRHRRNLPARGQRTRTNARTRKGPKKTVAGRGRRRGVKKYSLSSLGRQFGLYVKPAWRLSGSVKTVSSCRPGWVPSTQRLPGPAGTRSKERVRYYGSNSTCCAP